jgi:hypothetical protein
MIVFFLNPGTCIITARVTSGEHTGAEVSQTFEIIEPLTPGRPRIRQESLQSLATGATSGRGEPRNTQGKCPSVFTRFPTPHRAARQFAEALRLSAPVSSSNVAAGASDSVVICRFGSGTEAT